NDKVKFKNFKQNMSMISRLSVILIGSTESSTLNILVDLKEEFIVAKATKELPKRSEIPEERTWKLEDIFETDDLWEEELEQLKKDIPEITEYKGKLHESSETLYNVLKLQDGISER